MVLQLIKTNLKIFQGGSYFTPSPSSPPPLCASMMVMHLNPRDAFHVKPKLFQTNLIKALYSNRFSESLSLFSSLRKMHNITLMKKTFSKTTFIKIPFCIVKVALFWSITYVFLMVTYSTKYNKLSTKWKNLLKSFL